MQNVRCSLVSQKEECRMLDLAWFPRRKNVECQMYLGFPEGRMQNVRCSLVSQKEECRMLGVAWFRRGKNVECQMLLGFQEGRLQNVRCCLVSKKEDCRMLDVACFLRWKNDLVQTGTYVLSAIALAGITVESWYPQLGTFGVCHLVRNFLKRGNFFTR